MRTDISRGIFQFVWLCIYWYYMEQVGALERGIGKRVLGFFLTMGILVLSVWIPLWAVWLLTAVVMLLFDLFFDGEPFKCQWWRVLAPGLGFAVFSLFPVNADFLFQGLLLFLLMLLLESRRKSLQIGNGILAGAAFGLISAFLWLAGCTEQLEMEDALREVLVWGAVLLEWLLFFIVEGTLFFYKKGFEFQTEQLRKELMEHSYEEIKDIYMNMRGWRHDYHNHMQVMKAKLTMGDRGGLQAYLNQLESELERVELSVQSGNLMADAILNSKLTLAVRKKISVNCSARLPEKIPVEDVDLCIILGNLLDNAIEACEQVEEKDRRLRIYMTVNKNQFYLSVQNSAREDPDFNARNYITAKRGNHGLGMKRVKAAVDKYQGYLNLANEPGIFAAEVTLPLK